MFALGALVCNKGSSLRPEEKLKRETIALALDAIILFALMIVGYLSMRSTFLPLPYDIGQIVGGLGLMYGGFLVLVIKLFEDKL